MAVGKTPQVTVHEPTGYNPGAQDAMLQKFHDDVQGQVKRAKREEWIVAGVLGAGGGMFTGMAAGAVGASLLKRLNPTVVGVGVGVAATVGLTYLMGHGSAKRAGAEAREDAQQGNSVNWDVTYRDVTVSNASKLPGGIPTEVNQLTSGPVLHEHWATDAGDGELWQADRYTYADGKPRKLEGVNNTADAIEKAQEMIVERVADGGAPDVFSRFDGALATAVVKTKDGTYWAIPTKQRTEDGEGAWSWSSRAPDKVGSRHPALEAIVSPYDVTTFKD